jgi:hypothetical protein
MTYVSMMSMPNSRLPRIFAALAVLGVLLTLAPRTRAQIKSPGAHARYSVELEPHLVVQHSGHWRGDGAGFGPGFRATIPIVQNGPIPSINNSMGLGFGIDWSIFGGCQAYFNDDECNVNQVWVPIVVQWNFFFTPVISVFGEVGGAVVHRELSDRRNCGMIDASECTATDLDLFEPVFFGGGRFSFSRNVGLVVRVGVPYISIGADFLL